VLERFAYRLVVWRDGRLIEPGPGVIVRRKARRPSRIMARYMEASNHDRNTGTVEA
jgi:hypothetical protein